MFSFWSDNVNDSDLDIDLGIDLGIYSNSSFEKYAVDIRMPPSKQTTLFRCQSDVAKRLNYLELTSK